MLSLHGLIPQRKPKYVIEFWVSLSRKKGCPKPPGHPILHGFGLGISDYLLRNFLHNIPKVLDDFPASHVETKNIGRYWLMTWFVFVSVCLLFAA